MDSADEANSARGKGSLAVAEERCGSGERRGEFVGIDWLPKVSGGKRGRGTSAENAQDVPLTVADGDDHRRLIYGHRGFRDDGRDVIRRECGRVRGEGPFGRAPMHLPQMNTDKRR